VRCQSMPNWSIFSFTPGGKRVGELLGKGKIAVLAPSKGVVGHYQSLYRNTIPQIHDVKEINLFPPQARASPKTRVSQPIQQGKGAIDYHSTQSLAVSLYQVVSKRVQHLLTSLGTVPVGERSDVMTLIAREAFGWNTWLTEHGYALLIDPEEFLFRVGYELGLDEDRIGRILNSCSNGTPIRESMPGVHFYQGDAGCLNVVKYRSKR
jgi:hypothetical protein